MKRYIILILSFLILIELIILFQGTAHVQEQNIAQKNEHVLSMVVNGNERHFIVSLPKGHNTKTVYAAVLVLHVGGEGARYIMAETKWAQKAWQEGFVAVFLEGTRPNSLMPPGLRVNQQTWNDGSGRFLHHEEQNIDDVAFVEAILDLLISQFAVDEQRIFVTGFSNGASMTLRIGVELSHRVAAIALVAGGLWVEEPKLSRPVSLLYISGTKDLLPKEEEIMFGKEARAIKAPMQNLTVKWAEMIGCPLKANISEKSGVRKVFYSPCKDGSWVIRYSIEGVGNVWPNEKNFNATDVIWDFFKQHVK